MRHTQCSDTESECILPQTSILVSLILRIRPNNTTELSKLKVCFFEDHITTVTLLTLRTAFRLLSRNLGF
jgi:hypothetical protein